MGRNTEPFPADPRRFWFGNRGGDEWLICGEQDCFYLFWFRLFFNSSMYLICYLLGSTEQRWGESETNKGLAWSLPDGTSLSSCSIWGAFYLFWSGASGLLPSEASKMWGFFWSALTKCVLFRLLLWNTSHYYDRENRKPLAPEIFVVNQRNREQGSVFCLVVHILISCALLLLLIKLTFKNWIKILTINSNIGVYFISHLWESFKKSEYFVIFCV